MEAYHTAVVIENFDSSPWFVRKDSITRSRSSRKFGKRTYLYFRVQNTKGGTLEEDAPSGHRGSSFHSLVTSPHYHVKILTNRGLQLPEMFVGHILLHKSTIGQDLDEGLY